MKDGREFLPVGSVLELDSGARYRITGAPIGCGGGSVLYPAQKQWMENGVLRTDELEYVLKECYPAAVNRSFLRDRNGQILPAGGAEEDLYYLHRAQLLQLEEGTVSRAVYRTASRMLPVRTASRSVLLTLPGAPAVTVANTVTVMDSLARKGRSLTAWIRERRRFSAAETFRILQQLLFALREVHGAGYLHLDIQDGNVFLRGTLEDKDELVTLIDFGCARAMQDGRTEPIKDRVIFTTQGFSAPEILQQNDGSLQLGPEADIYSVGCLALYLLTGQRANVRDLMASRTGSYLRPNQLRRIHCPRHLVGTVQKILAKALAPDPRDRYPSADAMLAEVTDLADALQPYRTDLQSVKYDAFVCYKHNPVDSAAAVALQRALENYRAPKGISDKKRPFGRVFVDEGELSSCADFGQQIREALKNSGWLIVVCSPDTPLSPWVQEEIDTFLEYHDRSRILAVLTGGDPETSFPPQLKGDGLGREEVFAPHAFSSTPQEAEKQMRGDTLLKLAAPMLGTTYDTLKQRHKIYRLQRLAAAASVFLAVAVGFAAYAMNRAEVIAQQAARIRWEYEKALINESMFLSQQAEKKLAEMDPLGAMELALQALPSQTQDRPVLTAAEYALGKALGIYRTPSVTEDTVTPVGMIETDCPWFFLSPDGSRLFAWDDSASGYGGLVECWDAENLNLIWTHATEFGLGGAPRIAADGSLLLQGYHWVSSVDTETGRERWKVELDAVRTLEESSAGDELAVLSVTDTPEGEPQQILLTVLSAETGKILRSGGFTLEAGMVQRGMIRVSPDLRWAAVAAVEAAEEDAFWHSFHWLYLADLQTGTCRRLLESETEICDMLYADDRLLVLRSSGYTLVTQHNVLYEYDSKHTVYLESYSIPQGDLQWSREMEDYFETNDFYEILETPYNDGSTTGTGALFMVNDHCVLMDLESGRVVREYRLPAAATMVALTEKGFETVNTDGTYSATGFSLDTVMQIRYFGTDVSESCKTGEVYFLQSSSLTDMDHTIYRYRLNWYDDSYTPHFTADSNAWRVYGGSTLQDPGRVLLLDGSRVCLADLDTGESWLRSIPEDYAYSEYRILGTSHDGQYLYWEDSSHWEDPACWIGGSRFYALDLYTGEIRQLQQPEKPHPYLTVMTKVFADDKLYLAANRVDQAQDHCVVYVWDLSGDTLTELLCYALAPAPQDAEGDAAYQWESYLYGSLTYDRENRRISFAVSQNRTDILRKLIAVDVQTGQQYRIPLDLVPETGEAGYSGLCWDPSGSLAAFAFDGRLHVTDLSGKILCRIPAADPVVSLQFTPDGTGLLAVWEKGTVSRYSLEDFTCCATLDLTEHNSSLYRIYQDRWQGIFPDENTWLAVTGYGGLLVDISGDSLEMKALIDQCIGCDGDSGRFLVAETSSYSGKPVTLGSFPRYSVEDLIRKAEDRLKK